MIDTGIIFWVWAFDHHPARVLAFAAGGQMDGMVCCLKREVCFLEVALMCPLVMVGEPLLVPALAHRLVKRTFVGGCAPYPFCAWWFFPDFSD